MIANWKHNKYQLPAILAITVNILTCHDGVLAGHMIHAYNLHMKKVGNLEVISGPMFCGKTEELIRRVRRAQIANLRVVVIKHALDIRYKKRNVYSHSKQTLRSKVVKNAKDILNKVDRTTQVVAIDEAMWFGKELIPIVNRLVYSGKRVIVTGLSTTFTAEPFEPIPSLMAVAERVDKLTSICTLCGNDAIFHKKITSEKVDPYQISSINVGKVDKYEARCRACFPKS